MKRFRFDKIFAPITRHRLMLAYACGLAALLLAPYRFESPIVDNGARWAPSATIEFATPGIMRSKAPPNWLIKRLAQGTGFTLEVWAAARRNRPPRHARIVSYSHDRYARNFTLAQQGRDLIMRLRTTRTDANALEPHVLIEDGFATQVMQHVVVTYDFTRQRVYINGRRRFDLASPGGDFGNWSRGHALVLGNEATGERPWIGNLSLVALYDRSLRADEIERLYAAGAGVNAPRQHDRRDALVMYDFASPNALISATGGRELALEIPRYLVRGSGDYLSWPRELNHRSAYEVLEILANVLLFVPFGLLLYTGDGRHSSARCRRAAMVLAAGALTTASFESIQYFLPERTSSLVDSLANTAGVALGIGLQVR